MGVRVSLGPQINYKLKQQVMSTTKRTPKVKTPGQLRADAFHKWMTKKVKSIYSADSERMSEAYMKIYNA